MWWTPFVGKLNLAFFQVKAVVELMQVILKQIDDNFLDLNLLENKLLQKVITNHSCQGCYTKFM